MIRIIEGIYYIVLILAVTVTDTVHEKSFKGKACTMWEGFAVCEINVPFVENPDNVG